MEIFSFLPPAVFSFTVFKYTSNPSSHLSKKMPRIQFKRIQLLPNFTLTVKGRIIHLHHWFILSIILIFTAATESQLLSHTFMKGLMLGGITQGLTYKDRFRFIRRNLM